MARKFKIGDKVVPHSKTYYGETDDLNKCHQWQKANEIKQKYLYVVGYEDDAYVLSVIRQTEDGNFYTESDLTLYKEKDDVNNKNVKQDVISIETQPHFQSDVRIFSDGVKDVVNIYVPATTHRVIINGTRTIVILDDGSKGVSKLDPKDTYDKNKGYEIAYARAYVKKLNKRLKQLTK